MGTVFVFLLLLLFVFSLSKKPLPKTHHRVIGGTPSFIKNHPFQVQISIPTSSDDSACSGAILSPKFVITAGHCFKLSQEPGNYLVRMGTTCNGIGGITTKISKVVLHPEFSDDDHPINDIAIIELETPIKEFSSNIKAITLPATEDSTFLENEVGSVAGWGYLKTAQDDEPPIRLFKGTLQILNKEDCAKKIKDKKEQKVTENWKEMMCVIGNEQTTCRGDSGSPFTINDTLYGIVSFGIDCDKSQSAFLTRVSTYLDWIKEVSKI